MVQQYIQYVVLQCSSTQQGKSRSYMAFLLAFIIVFVFRIDKLHVRVPKAKAAPSSGLPRQLTKCFHNFTLLLPPKYFSHYLLPEHLQLKLTKPFSEFRTFTTKVYLAICTSLGLKFGPQKNQMLSHLSLTEHLSLKLTKPFFFVFQN